jgi:hypothetical protein
MVRHNYPSKETAQKVSNFYLAALKKNMQSDPAKVLFISQGGARYLENQSDLLNWIRAHYTLVSLARFYTDNVPPVVHSSFNYDMQMFKLKNDSGQ